MVTTSMLHTSSTRIGATVVEILPGQPDHAGQLPGGFGMLFASMAGMLVIFPDARRAVDNLVVVAAGVTDTGHTCPPLRPGFLRILRIDELEAWRLFVVSVAVQTDEIILTILRGVGDVEIEGPLAFAAVKRQAQTLGLTLSSRKVFGYEVEDEFDI